MKRHLERPSTWHVIVSCIALLYLGQIASALLNLSNPPVKHTFDFWVETLIGGIVLAGCGAFLIRELIRQRRLFKQWKNK